MLWELSYLGDGIGRGGHEAVILARSIALQVGGEGRVGGQGRLDRDDEIAGEVGDSRHWGRSVCFPRFVFFVLCGDGLPPSPPASRQQRQGRLARQNQRQRALTSLLGRANLVSRSSVHLGVVDGAGPKKKGHDRGGGRGEGGPEVIMRNPGLSVWRREKPRAHRGLQSGSTWGCYGSQRDGRETRIAWRLTGGRVQAVGLRWGMVQRAAAPGQEKLTPRNPAGGGIA